MDYFYGNLNFEYIAKKTADHWTYIYFNDRQWVNQDNYLVNVEK